eukprot:TRINITY_DN2531_c0_g1_i6.p1 TRINITY_DN2531_c0_g1~~TRINITY_DN2531_c0_g1_i6.p1  ORF type:complete len:134 (-),score=14.96 TRINITY_DN2531_c0_g1_i6:187-588(-)
MCIRDRFLTSSLAYTCFSCNNRQQSVSLVHTCCPILSSRTKLHKTPQSHPQPNRPDPQCSTKRTSHFFPDFLIPDPRGFPPLRPAAAAFAALASSCCFFLNAMSSSSRSPFLDFFALRGLALPPALFLSLIHI